MEVQEDITEDVLDHIRVMEDISDWDYIEKTQDLINASKHAFNELVLALKEPLKITKIDDEKMRTAIQAKKLALVDAKDILQIMQELEKMIGIDHGKLDLKEKATFPSGGPEKRFKIDKKKKK
jgi:hypothetical protein